ncbi:MAG: MoaD/ThiS family protein [Verrucomicrobia bacterium]|nr:MoaD/ThiS family protein [Verrucomicrobiota bacterium]
MKISVHFYSYFRDLTGTPSTDLHLDEGSTVGEAFDALETTFPKLRAARRCALMAVDVDYCRNDHSLKEGDILSLFPPVQGG